MSKEFHRESIYDTTIRLFILLLIIAWCLMLMFPFVNIILWSFILALALHPIHSKITKKIRGKAKLASFVIVFSILAVIILPGGLLIGSLIDEVKELKVSYDNGTLTIPHPEEEVKEWPVIGDKLYYTWLSSSVNLEQTVGKHREQLIEYGSKAAKSILSSAGDLIQIIISLIIAGILLVIGGAGEAIRKFFRKIAGGSKGDDFADLVLNTVGSVLKGVLGESLVMAMLFGIVFLLAGIPYAGLWTLLVFIISVLQLPLILVSLPALIYIFAVNETGTAIIWSIAILLVSLSNNILTPLMLGKGAPVPMPVIYIGVIGGFMLSGFIGLFTGAIVMSLGYTLLVEWIKTDNTETL